MEEIFTVRITQRWKSLKEPQRDSGVYNIKIQVVAKKEFRKQKTIDTGQKCTRDVYLALFPKFGSSDSVKRTRELKKLASKPENIEIKKKVLEVYHNWYDVVKGVTIANCVDRGLPRLANVVASVEGNLRASATLKPYKKEIELLQYHFVKYSLTDEGKALAMRSKKRMNSALNCFLKFKPGLKFREIDKAFLSDWQDYMRDANKQWDLKVKTFKTIQGYAKDLNTILDFIIDDSSLGYSTDDKPIGKGKNKWQMPSVTQNEAKIPRYLDEVDLENFKNYQPENEREELAKDVWFLSYYCGGCNAVDLVNFRKSNIQQEHKQLVFYRIKNKNKPSKTPSLVPLVPEAFELFEKYKTGIVVLKKFGSVEKQLSGVMGKEFLPNITGVPGSKFLLNFHQNSKNMMNTASNLRSLINDEKYLKAIAEKLEMKTSLNFQMARHTCATNLIRNGASTRVVMQIYGHASERTTENYINKLNVNETRKYIEKI